MRWLLLAFALLILAAAPGCRKHAQDSGSGLTGQWTCKGTTDYQYLRAVEDSVLYGTPPVWHLLTKYIVADSLSPISGQVLNVRDYGDTITITNLLKGNYQLLTNTSYSEESARLSYSTYLSIGVSKVFALAVQNNHTGVGVEIILTYDTQRKTFSVDYGGCNLGPYGCLSDKISLNCTRK